MNLKPNNKILNIALHIGIWSLIFFLPLLIVEKGEDVERFNRFVKRNFLNIGSSLFVFYINYVFLIRRQLFAKKYWQFVVSNIVLISLTLVAMRYAYLWVFHSDGEIKTPSKKHIPIALFYYWDTLSYLMNIGVAIAIQATNRLTKEEQKSKTAENERLQSELIYLKYQLQPHFFFNTLNNIYALIDAAPDKAKDTVLKLSKLMRYILYKSDEHVVLLSEEISFLQSYIDLMRIRYGSHVKIEVSVQASSEMLKIPPLLVVPLIENAFKHGVDATKPSFIHIEILSNKKEIKISIRNSYFPKTETDKSGSGIGLDNLKKRLELLFGINRYSLQHSLQGEVYVTELDLMI